MKDEPGIVVQKMRNILQDNRLSRSEIIALLHSGDVDYGDRRLENAACQISGLLIEEKVSIEESVTIFDACYRLALYSEQCTVSSEQLKELRVKEVIGV